MLKLPLWTAFPPILVSLALLLAASVAHAHRRSPRRRAGVPAWFAEAVPAERGRPSMDNLVLGFGGLGALLVLIAIRVPIAYTMILVGLVGTVLAMPRAEIGLNIVLNQLKDLGYAQFSNYDLSVLPMFILMGGLASRTGLSRDLFRAANAWLGRMRGGVAMAALVGCAGFGALCGSSTATASTMGQVALPELKRYKFSNALATGTVAAGGTLGILIPPSVVLIVYAIIVEANIVTHVRRGADPGPPGARPLHGDGGDLRARLSRLRPGGRARSRATS